MFLFICYVRSLHCCKSLPLENKQNTFMKQHLCYWNYNIWPNDNFSPRFPWSKGIYLSQPRSFHQVIWNRPVFFGLKKNRDQMTVMGILRHESNKIVFYIRINAILQNFKHHKTKLSYERVWPPSFMYTYINYII